jgi:Fe(3+) dicitrate transport protein
MAAVGVAGALWLMTAAAPAEPRAGRLVGTVTESLTGEAIPAAEVALLCADQPPVVAETDGHGSFALSAQHPDCALVVTQPGYRRQRVPLRNGQRRVDVALVSAQARPFETVVVGAGVERLKEDRRWVAGAYHRITEHDLEARRPVSVNDVLRQVPGVVVLDEDALGLRQNISIRGADPRQGRRVLVLEDGVPVAAGPYGDPEMFYVPPVERVARMDVAKGVDVVLHGPQTLGGVVHHLSADPPATLRSTGTLRVGSFGYLSAHASAGDAWGPAAWRLDVTHRRSAGPRALNAQLVDVAAKVRVGLGSGTHLTVKGLVTDERSALPFLGLTSSQFAHNPQDNFVPNDLYRMQRQHLMARHGVELPGGGTLQTLLYATRAVRGWDRQEFDRTDRGADYVAAVGPVPGDPLTQDGRSVFLRRSVDLRGREFRVAGVEERWTATASAPGVFLQWQAGGRAHVETVHETTGQQVAPASAGTVLWDEHRALAALAAFGQLRVSVLRVAHLAAGLRSEQLLQHRRILRETAARPDGSPFGKPVTTAQQAGSLALIPSLGGALCPLPWLTLHAGVHRGYAPPRTKDAITTRGEDNRLQAELSWNLEAGVRATPHPALSVEASAFLVEFQNQIINSRSAGSADGVTLVNQGRTRQWGTEAQLTVDPLRAWNTRVRAPVTVTHTFVDARFTAGVHRGRALPYAPPNVWVLRMALEDAWGLGANAAVTWVDAMYSDEANTVAPNAEGTVGRIPARALLDAGVSYSVPFSHLTFFANARNLAGHAYISTRFPQGIQPGAPRMLFAGVRFAP